MQNASSNCGWGIATYHIHITNGQSKVTLFVFYIMSKRNIQITW